MARGPGARRNGSLPNGSPAWPGWSTRATSYVQRGDRLIDLRDHPLQRDYWWGSAAFEAGVGLPQHQPNPPAHLPRLWHRC